MKKVFLIVSVLGVLTGTGIYSVTQHQNEQRENIEYRDKNTLSSSSLSSSSSSKSQSEYIYQKSKNITSKSSFLHSSSVKNSYSSKINDYQGNEINNSKPTGNIHTVERADDYSKVSSINSSSSSVSGFRYNDNDFNEVN